MMNLKAIFFSVLPGSLIAIGSGCAQISTNDSAVKQDQYSSRICGLLSSNSEGDIFSVSGTGGALIGKFKTSGQAVIAKAKSFSGQLVCVDRWTSGSDPFAQPITDGNNIRLQSSLKKFEKCGKLYGPVADSSSFTIGDIAGMPEESALIYVSDLQLEMRLVQSKNKSICISAHWAPRKIAEYTEVASFDGIRFEDNSKFERPIESHFVISHATYLKILPKDSNILADYQKCLLPKGAKITVLGRNDDPNTGHSMIIFKKGSDSLNANICRGFTGDLHSFVYTKHIL